MLAILMGRSRGRSVIDKLLKKTLCVSHFTDSIWVTNGNLPVNKADTIW